jgi:hypothetical protein
MSAAIVLRGLFVSILGRLNWKTQCGRWMGLVMLTRTPVLRIIVLDVFRNVFICVVGLVWGAFSAYDPGVVVVARCVNNGRECADVRILYGPHKRACLLLFYFVVVACWRHLCFTFLDKYVILIIVDARGLHFWSRIMYTINDHTADLAA